MKNKYLSILIFVIPFLGWSQQFELVTPLNDLVQETSGLIYLNNKLITHNDSGGEPALYELDSLTGTITRKVTITNATNYDWEDICNDSTYIYIADMGNNNGDRTNLKIYRVAISDYLIGNTANADIINFGYSDQTNFTSNPYAHNFDAEALISFKDSLYIFTKNWVDQRTNIYALSKTPGTYSISKIDSFNANCLVTGATYNPVSNRVVLSGYTLNSPFVIELNGFTPPLFSDGIIKKYPITPPQGYSIQVESIATFNENKYYLTAEKNNGFSGLYRLKTESILGVENLSQIHDSIYPNPASSTVEINYPNAKTVEIYNITGVLMLTSSSTTIDVTGLQKGTYILVIYNQKNTKIGTQKLIIE